MEKQKKNAYSAEKTAEQNVRAGCRKHGGSYLATAKDLDRLRNVSRKHSYVRKKFKSSELLALRKKARAVARNAHKADRYEKEYKAYKHSERKAMKVRA